MIWPKKLKIFTQSVGGGISGKPLLFDSDFSDLQKEVETWLENHEFYKILSTDTEVITREEVNNRNSITLLYFVLYEEAKTSFS